MSARKVPPIGRLSYVGAVMTLPTGVQALAEANYGHPDEAFSYLDNLTNSFSYALPGSMYEVSPDYGMITQAWNIYAVATPIIEKFFGIRPQAGMKRLSIQPMMPSDWNNVSLKNILVGDNEISIEKSGNQYTIYQTKKDWKIDFISSDRKVIMLNQEELPPADTLRLTGLKSVIELE